MYIEGNGFSSIYQQICSYLLTNGKKSSPRNMNTQEIEGAIIKLKNPRTRILNKNLRKISMPFALGEWLWCMEGRKDLEMIQYYAPSYNKYSDNGQDLNGAYGPRIRKCVENIIKLLKKDPNSRRAVIPIYSQKDVGVDSNDIPCTLNFQFLIRDNKLNMSAIMRSNDIFLGLPYDVFNFTMWQEYIANKLNIEIGSYTHIVNNMHFYEKDREKIEKASIINNIVENKMPKMPIKDIEKQLLCMYNIEEQIRKNKEYKTEEQNSYFINFTKELESYNKKIKSKGNL